MKFLLYHVQVVAILAAAACGGRSPSPSTPAGGSSPSSSAASAASSPTRDAQSPAPTVTSEAIARGKAVIERVRTAAGGAAVTRLRSIKATGTSEMTALKVTRNLTLLALYPQFFRLDEAPVRAGGRGFHTTFGLQDTRGWITGASLGGDGQSKDPERAAKAYARAARQVFAGFMAGMNPAWLVDSGTYTVLDAGTVPGGDDRGAIVVDFEGPDGKAGRLIVDPDTHLPRRFIEPPQPTGGGAAAHNEAVYTYSRFSPVGGVQLPHAIVRQVGSGRTTWTITAYEINPVLTPRAFSQIARTGK